MSDMVPEVLNAALDSLFTPKEPGEQEYQGEDGLLYCRNCHTPVQCRVKLWGRDKIVPCLCRCQQEAMAEKKRQDELVERQRKIRQLKATGIQEKHLLEWNFGVAEDNKDIQMAKRYVEQWKKVKAENLGLLLWGDVGTGKSFVAACIANALLDQGIPVLMTNFSKILNQMTIKNLRCLTGGKSMELAYAMALKLAEESEKLTLLTRALPAYTGNPRALQDVDAVAAESVPIEAGFTIEGWFCIRLPLLLPKKERGSASYVRGILYPALRNFFQGKAPVRYPESIMIFRHVYEKGRPERRYRDHDNIEINMVSDTVAMYVLTDDAPPCCDHFYCSAASTQERTEVYVVPARDFPQWLVLEPLIPDEGVMLHENVPERRQKHV